MLCWLKCLGWLFFGMLGFVSVVVDSVGVNVWFGLW